MVERLGRRETPFLDEFAASAGLDWEIVVLDAPVPSPHIRSLPREQRHEILTRFDKMEHQAMESALAHEVGHAWINENIGLAVGIDTHPQDPGYRGKIEIVNRITSFVDVWATDVVVEVLKRRDLAGEQIRGWLSTGKKTRRLDIDRFILQYAIHAGLAARHGFTSLPSRLDRLAFESRKVIGRQQVGIMERLAEVCKELPLITEGGGDPIGTYVEITYRYADILGIDLRPRLINYEGYNIWTFE